MAYSLNKIMLIGNLGKDPETRYTTNQNIPVTSFSLATTHSYKSKDGNWVNETTWHNIVAWNLSDFLRDSLKKGSKAYIEGRVTNREYLDKEQKKRYITEIIVDRIIPLDAREPRGGEGDSGFSAGAPAPIDQGTGDDDLPF